MVGSAPNALLPFSSRFSSACLRTIRACLHAYGSPLCLSIYLAAISCIHSLQTARVLRCRLSISCFQGLSPFRRVSFRTWCITSSSPSFPHSSQHLSISLSARVGYGTLMTACGRLSTSENMLYSSSGFPYG